MALFGGYQKNRSGVSKEDAMRRDYFAILFRHFGSLILVNVLFMLCNLILIAAAVFFALPYILDFENILAQIQNSSYILLPPWPFIPFMFMGPFIAGLTYVTRNWASQNHAFVVSDFFEHTKKNWKQGLLLSVLGTIIVYLLLTAVIFYLRLGINPKIVLFLAVIFAAIFFSISFYTYPLAVTFDLKLKDILKNSWILALAKLPQNLFFVLIISIVHGLLISYITVLWIILFCLILISWSSFTINYYVTHVMELYLVPDEEPSEVESVFED